MDSMLVEQKVWFLACKKSPYPPSNCWAEMGTFFIRERQKQWKERVVLCFPCVLPLKYEEVNYFCLLPLQPLGYRAVCHYRLCVYFYNIPMSVELIFCLCFTEVLTDTFVFVFFRWSNKSDIKTWCQWRLCQCQLCQCKKPAIPKLAMYRHTETMYRQNGTQRLCIDTQKYCIDTRNTKEALSDS